MPDSVNVDGECNTLCTSLSAVDQQLPIAIGATPVVNQRQHHLVDVPARHGCYHGTRPRTPVGTGKTRLRKIQATERPTHSVPLRAMGRCQCWRSRAAPDLRPCEGYPRKACSTGNFLLLHPHMGRIIHSICCHLLTYGNLWNRSMRPPSARLANATPRVARPAPIMMPSCRPGNATSIHRPHPRLQTMMRPTSKTRTSRRSPCPTS